MKHFTIAIDGPGGAGKSTVADHLAAQLGVPHLDTGAMYRAFGFQALQEQLDPRDPAQMAELATRIRMEVRFENGRQHTLVNGVDVCKFGKQWVVSIDAMKREYGAAVR